jgi:hypothetical protein
MVSPGLAANALNRSLFRPTQGLWGGCAGERYKTLVMYESTSPGVHLGDPQYRDGVTVTGEGLPSHAVTGEGLHSTSLLF